MSSQDGLSAPFLAQYLGFIVSLLSQIKTYFTLPPLIYISDLTLCLGRPDNLEGYDSFFRIDFMAISSHKHAGLVVIARFSPKGRPLPRSDTTYSTRLTMLHEDGEPIKSKSSRSQTSSCPTFSDMIYIYWHESEV